MRVLIVENDPELSGLWSRHLQRQGAKVDIARHQADAIEYISAHDHKVIVLSLDLSSGSSIAIADFASYRRPLARVIFVTRSSFFSDGSIFSLVPNTAALVPAETPPADLAAIIEHHAAR